ncbi:hypothetical protein CBR_g31268 [Chara braunii]|uniref:Uncharacterized protein ycf23 n=1 Tax=Chara braunii TaxID=69332 RepID=A0A388JY51_CHABU|nr:hypothetical protein CBR_g31268 [Chara braunii]|eukprot:GBG62633.1 hypothetical protein CBR_g31268 [Chara braunii]
MSARALAHVVPVQQQQQEFCSLSSLAPAVGGAVHRHAASLVTFKPLISRNHGASQTLRMTTTGPLLRPPLPPAVRHERRASHTHIRAAAAAARDNGGLGGNESRPTGNQKKRNAVREYVLKPFQERRALKIISGLHNLDAENVAAVVAAADQGGATHVDIASDPELVRMALEITTLPVCVSSVDPDSFIAAVDAGAHMIEIGNYDSFYKEGRTFSAAEVLELTCRTRQLLPRIVLSVTVPHTLPLDEQVKLAEALEAEGVDIIQTEGGTSSSPTSSGVHGLIEKGVGSAVNKLNSKVAMVCAVRAIADALGISSAVSVTMGSHI